MQGSLPLTPWPELIPDAVSRAGRAQPQLSGDGDIPALPTEQRAHRLPEQILAGKPYPVNALFLYYTNPVFSSPLQSEWERALARIPFIVSFSPFMDETTAQADLILPDCTYLERWRDDEITHLAGITAFSIGQPVVPPVHNTRATEDVVLQLAHGMGEPMAGAMPWASHVDLLREKARGLYEAGRGFILMPSQQVQFEEILARQGYWRRQFETFEAFWEGLVERGAWWDANDTYVGPRQLFATPSRRFEFYSQLLRSEVESRLGNTGGADRSEQLARWAVERGLQIQGDLLFMPHQEPVPTEEREAVYPFVLNSYKLMSLAGGRGANQPWLQQQPAVHVEGGWDSWVEIHPGDAEALGIEEGEPVRLESERGSITATARIFAGTRPGMLNMPHGWGHRAYGRWARGRGGNQNGVLEPWTDALRGLPAWSRTRVRLSKI